MKLWRTKFGLKSILIAVLVVSCFLAWLTHLRHSGVREAASVEHLNNSGCWILPDYQLSTVPSATEDGRFIQTRSHGSSPYETKFAWILGDEYYGYHSDVIVEQKLPAEELIKHLRNLRKLKYVFYMPNTFTESDVIAVQSELPNIRVVSAMKLGNKR